jgi:hypothetical protein
MGRHVVAEHRPELFEHSTVGLGGNGEAKGCVVRSGHKKSLCRVAEDDDVDGYCCEFTIDGAPAMASGSYERRMRTIARRAHDRGAPMRSAFVPIRSPRMGINSHLIVSRGMRAPLGQCGRGLYARFAAGVHAGPASGASSRITVAWINPYGRSSAWKTSLWFSTPKVSRL